MSIPLRNVRRELANISFEYMEIVSNKSGDVGVKERKEELKEKIYNIFKKNGALYTHSNGLIILPIDRNKEEIIRDIDNFMKEFIKRNISMEWDQHSSVVNVSVAGVKRPVDPVMLYSIDFLSNEETGKYILWGLASRLKDMEPVIGSRVLGLKSNGNLIYVTAPGKRIYVMVVDPNRNIREYMIPFDGRDNLNDIARRIRFLATNDKNVLGEEENLSEKDILLIMEMNPQIFRNADKTDELAIVALSRRYNSEILIEMMRAAREGRNPFDTWNIVDINGRKVLVYRKDNIVFASMKEFLADGIAVKINHPSELNRLPMLLEEAMETLNRIKTRSIVKTINIGGYDLRVIDAEMLREIAGEEILSDLSPGLIKHGKGLFVVPFNGISDSLHNELFGHRRVDYVDY